MSAVVIDSGSANSSGDARRRNCPRSDEIDTGPVVWCEVGFIGRGLNARSFGPGSFIAEFDHLLGQSWGACE